MWWYTLLGLCGTILAVARPAVPESNHSDAAVVGMSISGRVVYEDDRSPCGGCAVTARGRKTFSAVSGVQGEFRLKGLPAGKYTLFAENPDGEGGFLLEHLEELTMQRGINARGVVLVAPKPSGRPPTQPATVECEGPGLCLMPPCDPAMACCKAFSIEVPAGPRPGPVWVYALTVSPDGSVTKAEMLRSSGNPDFDELALAKYKENACFEASEKGTVVTATATLH